jgi:acetoacetyl-CoA synthetase
MASRRTNATIVRLARKHGFENFDDLHAWSIADLPRFWSEASEFLGVRWHDYPTAALADHKMPSTAWFPGGTLNYAEHALARAAVAPDDIAVIEHSQTRSPRTLTWAQLADQVARCAAGLEALGVTADDRVGSFCPNIVETLVTFLATATLGAVWSSCAPEFGPRAVIDRFVQFEPTVLLHVDGYRYGSKEIDRRNEVAEILEHLPSVRTTISVQYLGSGPDEWSPLIGEARHEGFAAVPYDRPIYVLYSSGTTGLPKPIVHSHVGITLEHLVVHALHSDHTPSDRLFWFTTTGWMMWNFLVSGLLVGSSIVLFDGDPATPDLNTLWDVAERSQTTVFGASAGFFMNCRKAGLTPNRGEFWQIGSTGAPLPLEGFEWLSEALGADVVINSISGGTDICSCFVGWNPMVPVVNGEIAGQMLGRQAAAFDEDGNPCPTGVQGELVVTTPMPSMPLGFLGDPDGSRYHRAYFERFPGVWCHGDWITFTGSGGCIISGRSDATLNRGGVRLGSAEFYTVVETLPEVVDSLVVHLDEGDVDRLYLFVQLREGVHLDDLLRARIRAELRAALSPRHSPDVIEAVPLVPRTLSGKKLEVPVKKILSGQPADKVLSSESLAVPAAIDWFVQYASQPSVLG